MDKNRVSVREQREEAQASSQSLCFVNRDYSEVLMVNPRHATKAVSSSVPYSSSTVKEAKGEGSRPQGAAAGATSSPPPHRSPCGFPLPIKRHWPKTAHF